MLSAMPHQLTRPPSCTLTHTEPVNDTSDEHHRQMKGRDLKHCSYEVAN
jgi:hypothetical protein